MTDAGISWTEERVAFLTRLWSDGLSASQIAAQIGGVTRNAVIGKVHRLGLAGRGKPNGAAAPRQRKVERTQAPAAVQQPALPNGGGFAPKMAEAPRIVPELLDEDGGLPISERVTLMELRESMCRWPLGDPTTPEFRFCGGRSIAGQPYCPHHSRIAYQPAAERKRDRRIAMRA